MANDTAPILIPKAQLPDCEVGETLEIKITGEEGDNFVAEKKGYEEEEPAESAPMGKGKMPPAVMATM